jgi:hypothetical protein
MGISTGATLEGGPADGGLIYKLTPSGKITAITTFPRVMSSPFVRNFGSTPKGRLAEGADGVLYTTTHDGGAFGCGLIYEMTTSGKVSPLYHYLSPTGGVEKGSLISAEDGTLLGFTAGGQTLLRLFRDGTQRTLDIATATGSGGVELIINSLGEVLVATFHKGIWKLTPMRHSSISERPAFFHVI